jgi:glycosyltransferase involved in cell wall biosynthesis
MPERQGALRQQLDIPDGSPIVLYVGRIAGGKGVEYMLEAARRLPSAHVVLMGPDERHGTMDVVRLAQADAATRERIHVLPPHFDPPHWLYPEADLFVLASSGDSFGLVAAEAAAAGTPVIVSTLTGVAGFFRPGEAIVVSDDQEAVVGAIGRVVEDETLRRRLSDGGKEAARRLSWEHVTDIQEEIYRTALRSRAERDTARRGRQDVSRYRSPA